MNTSPIQCLGLLAVAVNFALGGCGLATDADGVNRPMRKLVFGADERQEATTFDGTRLWRAIAATGALVRAEDLSCHGDLCALSTEPMTTGQTATGNVMPLCPGTRFAGQQQRTHVCTAFLVGPRLMATAGHCIATQEDCDTHSVVFDFVAEPDGSNEATTFAAEEVYACDRVVAQEHDFGGRDDQDDWAVFQLDRVVQGRYPLAIRRSGVVGLDEELVSVGHPSGLPKKVASNGFVQANSGAKKFRHSLDLAGGNSGSPVLSLPTLVVEGIHAARAASHYVAFPDNTGCAMEHICDAGSGCDPEVLGVWNRWSGAMRMAGSDQDFPARSIPLRPVEVMAVL